MELLPEQAAYQLIRASGGTARNAVPDQAEFVLASDDSKGVLGKLMDFAKQAGIQADLEEHEGQIYGHVYGRTAHAMFPERGVNAVAHMMKLLGAIYDQLDAGKIVNRYNRYISDDTTGALFGAACTDEESGALTFNVGKLIYHDGKMQIQAGMRCPVSKGYDPMLTNIRRLADCMECELDLVDYLAPIYYRRDDEVVMALDKAYRTVTADTVNEPFCVGAASYARALNNTVAFGPIFPGQEEMSHQPNEFISLNGLKVTTEIYIEALKNLLGIGI